MPRQQVIPSEPRYVPSAGSIAARALEYLLEHGETAAGPLADALDVEINSLNGGVSYALRQGVIATVRKPDGLHYYRVGDNVPPVRERFDDEPDAEPIIQRHVPVTGSDL